MFQLLRFVVWTGCAMAAGAWMATAHVLGATPLEHLEHAWKQTPVTEKVTQVAAGLEEKLEDAKDSLATAKDRQVRERHSEKDKEAVSKLIAKRAAK